MPPNSSFHGVFIEYLIQIGNQRLASSLLQQKREMKMLLLNGIVREVVKPIPRTVFDKDQVEEAFRFMTVGKHTGKVLIKIKDEESPLSNNLYFPAVPRAAFDPGKTYLIIGGLGGMGLELVKWMAMRGARKMLVSSRSGVKTAYQKYALDWVRRVLGAQVSISRTIVVNESSAADLLAEAEDFGPVGGVFNLALVLKDGLIENQTKETFFSVCQPKAIAAIYLDKMTRCFYSELDYFVCFSSIVTGQGNGGQSNYGYANGVMERICDKRRADGLHGLAIEWGIVADIGYVVE